MPDRQLNDDGTVVDLDAVPPTVDAPHLHPDAIAACTRCGRDGYRGLVVCDHQDHETGAGRAAVDAALAEIRHRKVEQAKRAYGSDRPASTEADETAAGDQTGAEGAR